LQRSAVRTKLDYQSSHQGSVFYNAAANATYVRHSVDTQFKDVKSLISSLIRVAAYIC
jgi:hypothetical protein